MTRIFQLTVKQCDFNIGLVYYYTVPWDEIAIRYDLGGLGIESRRGARFSAPVQTASGSYPNSSTMGTELFPSSSAEVKERVELYLYFSPVFSWQVIG
jgi:hypothetical protein